MDDSIGSAADLTGFDAIGEGFPAQLGGLLPSSRRTVKISLPKFPLSGPEGPSDSDGPTIEVEAIADGTTLDVEVKITGDIVHEDEYAAIMALLSQLV